MRYDLQDLRLENRIPQRELAERFGVAQSTYRMWERGLRSISPDRVREMAEIFQVPLESIAHWSDSVPRKRTNSERALPQHMKSTYRLVAALEQFASQPLYKKPLKNRARTLATLLVEDLTQKEEKLRGKKKGSKV